MTRQPILRVAILLAIVTAPAGLHAQSTTAPAADAAGDKGPPAFRRLIECRTIADDKARLACYDSSTDALAAAQQKGEVTVVDRQAVRKAKRGLFGFSLAGLDLFDKKPGDGSAATDDVDQITGVVRGVTRNADGYYIVTLEDGARWEQISAQNFGRAPRPGSTVTISKAAFGSYKMAIDKNPGVKARRIG